MDTHTELVSHLRAMPVVAVVVVEDADHAVPLAEALLRGGVTTVEVTLRSDAALDAIEAIATAVPQIAIGAGTVLHPDQCRAVQERGARFAVAPGTNPTVLDRAASLGLPFIPGVATPTEIETAVGLGARLLKLFPAEPLGGPAYLQAIAAPYRHLGLEFMPTGGVTAESVDTWLDTGLVAAVGGTWLARGADIAARDWHDIEGRARVAAERVAARKMHP